MKVSIIITNFNYGKYLARCIRSCMSQSFETNEFEIIVTDDNSTDDSLAILEQFKKNITIIRNKKNIGVAASVNKAVKIAKGDYFIRVDSDDYISNHLISFLYNSFLIFPKKLGIAADYYHIDKDEKILSINRSKYNPIACGILYDKKKFIKFGKYNNKFRHREEEELRLRLSNKYDIHYLNLPLYKYRLHYNNKTKSKNYLVDFKKKIENISTNKNFKNLKKSKLVKDIVVIIPARGNSKRFKNKNISIVQGKPMIFWVLNELKKSKILKDIFVSSENKTILNYVKKQKIKTILRPKKLSEDGVFKLDVVRHAVLNLEKKLQKKFSLVLSIQANSPEIKINNIEDCIKKLINENLQEVISVDRFNNCNAAIRVMTREALFQEDLSTNHGFFKIDINDIHYKNDLNKLKKLR